MKTNEIKETTHFLTFERDNSYVKSLLHIAYIYFNSTQMQFESLNTHPYLVCQYG